MSRLRRRDLIPDDTPIMGIFKDTKIVRGNWGRQLQADVLVTKGEYKGTQFPVWFSFGKDDSDGEEYIPYMGPLFQAFAMVEPDLENIVDDDNLSDREYEKFIKNATKKLDGFEFRGRAGIKEPKDKEGNPKLDKNGQPKRNQILQPGSFGPAEDPDKIAEQIPF